MKRLTLPQFEVLQGLQKGLTITEISSYRSCSRTAVYKLISLLLRRGMIEKIDKSYSLTSGGIEGLHSFVGLRYNLRQHNLHFKFQILESPKNWKLKRNKISRMPYFNKKIKLKNNEQELFNFGKVQIRTTSKSIIIKIPTIYEKSVDKAVIQSFHILEQIVPKVERLFNIKIIKDYKANVTIISQEYARINDSLAKLYRKEADRLYVTGDDGKIWMITDFSFSQDETEFIHPDQSPDDTQVMSKHLNDIRKYDPPTNSQLATHIMNLTQGFQNYGDHIVSHTKAIQTLSKAIPQLVNILKSTKEENEQLKQRRLDEYTTNK